jgi:hypothetical protein
MPNRSCELWWEHCQVLLNKLHYPCFKISCNKFWFDYYSMVTCVLDSWRSYALGPEHNEATFRPNSEEQSSVHDVKPDPEETESKDVVLPGVNLIFDGAELHPFDIAACLQARQPLWLISEASTASSALLWGAYNPISPSWPTKIH